MFKYKINHFYFFKFLLIYLSILFFFNNYPLNIEIIQEKKTLFFGIMSSYSSLERAKVFQKYLYQKNKSKNIDFKFFTSDVFSNVTDLNYQNLDLTLPKNIANTYPVHSNHSISIDLIYKYFVMLKIFIYSPHHYFLRLTDDVYVNFEFIDQYIYELSKEESQRFNSILIQGNCLNTSEILLQGGTGYLLSKSAAIVLLKIFPEILSVNNNWEDWILGSFFLKIEPNPLLLNSNRFIGHGFSYLTFLQHKFKFMFLTCPKSFQTISCSRSLNKLKDVYFYHQLHGYHSPYEIEDMLSYYKAENIFYYQSKQHLQICKQIKTDFLNRLNGRPTNH